MSEAKCLQIDGVEIVIGQDYKEREYTGEYVIRKDREGPGYYIYQYSDAGKWLIRLAARPNVPYRKYPTWNPRVRRGWRTLREAKEILKRLPELIEKGMKGQEEKPVYQYYSGFWFHPDTIEEVKKIIHIYHETYLRLRFVYGDVETGEAWITEEDAKRYGVKSAGEEGYIGRSTGREKIPLAIHNNRCYGGPAIMTQCIIRIELAQGGRVLYSHPTFHWRKEGQGR